MEILEKVKTLREQMYKAAKENDIDKIYDISKEWDILDNGVTSEMLIFEALAVANAEAKDLKKRAHKLEYNELREFKKIVRKENTYEDFLFGWVFKWDKTSKTFDEVNDEIWDRVDDIKKERIEIRKLLKNEKVENKEELEERLRELVYDRYKWRLYSEYLADFFYGKEKERIERTAEELDKKEKELAKRIENENLNQGLFKK